MGSGFNTNVRAGDRMFHVQTEDRGPAHSKIDTAVYFEGRVIHRQSSPYVAGDGPSAKDDERQNQVEQQHREIIDSLKAGWLPSGAILAGGNIPGGAERRMLVALLNATSWISSGEANLRVIVQERGIEAAPVSGARVTASFETASPTEIHEATTGPDGRAQIRFPLPASGIGGATLVIRAVADAGEDEIRFQLRAKPKASAPEK
jgi:hypothetical protein